jgi:hypothetical protein
MVQPDDFLMSLLTVPGGVAGGAALRLPDIVLFVTILDLELAVSPHLVSASDASLTTQNTLPPRLCLSPQAGVCNSCL